ncbi:MAG: phage holin family protein [Lysobacterales bacterium]
MSALQRELRALVHDQVQLAGLELRLAAHSLMTMIAAAVCIGAMLVVVWLGLLGAAGLGLMKLGLAPALVLLMLSAFTLVLAGLLGLLIRRRSRDLGLPASLRALKPPAAGNRNGETI